LKKEGRTASSFRAREDVATNSFEREGVAELKGKKLDGGRAEKGGKLRSIRWEKGTRTLPSSGRGKERNRHVCGESREKRRNIKKGRGLKGIRRPKKGSRVVVACPERKRRLQLNEKKTGKRRREKEERRSIKNVSRLRRARKRRKGPIGKGTQEEKERGDVARFLYAKKGRPLSVRERAGRESIKEGGEGIKDIERQGPLKASPSRVERKKRVDYEFNFIKGGVEDKKRGMKKDNRRKAVRQKGRRRESY